MTSTVLAAAQGNPLPGLIVMALFGVLMISAYWKVFAKAGEPGWAAIVPIYNVITLLKIAGKPAWWLVLFFIPVVNFITILMVTNALAKNFGKGTGFGLGLAFLSPVFYPVLGFGSSSYQKTV